MLDRLINKTDPAEMQRRWNATLSAMEKEDIDCLILGAYDRVCPGATKYLTDMLVVNYPHYFLFSKDGIAVWGQGDRGKKMYGAYHEFDNVFYNVAIPSLPSITYSADWYPEDMTATIKRMGYKKVAWCGMYNIPAAIYKYLTENLAEIEFCNFTDQMDHIRAVKSDYEIGLWQACVTMHDELWACLPAVIKVGMTERQISRKIRSLADEMGSLDYNVMLGSDPKRPVLVHYPYQNKVVEKGDYLQLLIEISGLGGVWAEVSRVISLGEPSKTMMKADADQLKCQDYVAEISQPGVPASEVFKKMNEMLTGMGYLPEHRFAVHGQGYEIVDRPIFVAEETMVLQENMFFASHPTVANDEVSLYNCDNFVVKPGGSKKLSKTPPGLLVIDR